MKYFKAILMILFFVLFLMFAFVAISIMRNHYLGIYPDKITVEFESSLIYSIYSASFSIVFFQLFYSLYKYKRWQRFAFWMFMLLWLIIQFLYPVTETDIINWTPKRYIFMTILCDLVPVLVGAFISDHISQKKSTI